MTKMATVTKTFPKLPRIDTGKRGFFRIRDEEEHRQRMRRIVSTKRNVEKECVVLYACVYLERVLGAFYRQPESIVLVKTNVKNVVAKEKQEQSSRVKNNVVR